MKKLTFIFISAFVSLMLCASVYATTRDGVTINNGIVSKSLIAVDSLKDLGFTGYQTLINNQPTNEYKLYYKDANYLYSFKFNGNSSWVTFRPGKEVCKYKLNPDGSAGEQVNDLTEYKYVNISYIGGKLYVDPYSVSELFKYYIPDFKNNLKYKYSSGTETNGVSLTFNGKELYVRFIELSQLPKTQYDSSNIYCYLDEVKVTYSEEERKANQEQVQAKKTVVKPKTSPIPGVTQETYDRVNQYLTKQITKNESSTEMVFINGKVHFIRKDDDTINEKGKVYSEDDKRYMEKALWICVDYAGAKVYTIGNSNAKKIEKELQNVYKELINFSGSLDEFDAKFEEVRDRAKKIVGYK